MLKLGQIEKAYSLKQIRPTAAYYFINELKMSIYSVQQLLDHSTVKITEKHYASLNLKNTKMELDGFKFEDFLFEGENEDLFDTNKQ